MPANQGATATIAEISARFAGVRSNLAPSPPEPARGRWRISRAIGSADLIAGVVVLCLWGVVLASRAPVAPSALVTTAVTDVRLLIPTMDATPSDIGPPTGPFVELPWRNPADEARQAARTRLNAALREPPAGNGSDAPSEGVRPDLASAAPEGEHATPVQSTSATVKSIRRDVLPGIVRVIIELDADVLFHHEQLPDPPRVFVDLRSTGLDPALKRRTIRFDDELVKQIRIGRHDDTTRIVLDTTAVSRYSVHRLESPYRLVVDCVSETAGVATNLLEPPLREAGAGAGLLPSDAVR